MITDLILVFTIVLLMVYLIWEQVRHEKVVNELIKKLKPGITPGSVSTVPTTKVDVNTILKTDENEVMLSDMPFMEIPEDYNIEHEGGPETPTEAVARKGK